MPKSIKTTTKWIDNKINTLLKDKSITGISISTKPINITIERDISAFGSMPAIGYDIDGERYDDSL